ncbi:hypothetical protein SAMN05421827_12335 [Pedobacter terrae]|uniref:Uncharacterized protein n=1 Tax=Pedobacter terrae TaxID=405671 RepID=A0A1G8C1H3_9SPHI|nr:hypothetical protein SAMN05421827_12335 [Pedobacter terrae]
MKYRVRVRYYRVWVARRVQLSRPRRLYRFNKNRYRRLSFGNSFGILLTDFNKARILTKDAVNPKSQGNQKNSCSSGKLALTNLKRSGFVFINDNLNFKRILNTKQSDAVFLMRKGLCKRLIAGLTKRFGYFGAPKYHASAA